MNKPVINSGNSNSAEVHGLMLRGLVDAFTEARAIGPDAGKWLGDIHTDRWYDIGCFFDQLNWLTQGRALSPSHLVQAGKSFMENWYFNGGGRDIVKTGLEYLEFQANSQGYLQVVRGDAEEIGYVELVDLDEDKGFAIIESLNPFPGDFERGVFTAGLTLPGDMAWAKVTTVSEPRGPLSFKRSTIRFYQLEKDISTEIEQRLESLSPELSETIPSHLLVELAWKYRGLQEHLQHEHQYWLATNKMLEYAWKELSIVAEKLENLATIDELTGLMNRRKTLELGQLEFNKLHRSELPLSLLMLDIDFFKEINDSHGHAEGDIALKIFAKRLVEGLRITDHVGRIGGEEFLIILPDTDAHHAMRVAEKIRENISSLTHFTRRGQPVKLTVSIGISTIESPTWNFEYYLRQADSALYEVKNMGRNNCLAFRNQNVGLSDSSKRF